jgi:hypothetical protein
MNLSGDARMIRQSVSGLATRSCALLLSERDRTQNRVPLLLIALSGSRIDERILARREVPR